MLDAEQHQQTWLLRAWNAGWQILVFKRGCSPWGKGCGMTLPAGGGW